MIRITIELISARTGETTRLASATIANDDTGSPTHGNYNVDFFLKRRRVWRMSRVEHFPRKRRNVWYLLREALNALGAENAESADGR